MKKRINKLEEIQNPYPSDIDTNAELNPNTMSILKNVCFLDESFDYDR